MNPSIGRTPLTIDCWPSEAISLGAVAEARSTQPTTPRTNPREAAATSTRNRVSAALGAACTSTVPVTPPSKGCRSSRP